MLLPRTLAAFALSALILVAADRSAAQQKKVLTHAEYDAWNKESNVTLSADGKYVAYIVTPLDGRDAEVIVRNVGTGTDVKFARGGKVGDGPAPAPGSPTFSPNSSRVVVPLSPTKAEIEKAKAAKVKNEDMPKPVLAIVNLPGGDIAAKLPYEKNFTLGGEAAGFLLYYKPTTPEPKIDSPDTKRRNRPGRERGRRSPRRAQAAVVVEKPIRPRPRVRPEPTARPSPFAISPPAPSARSPMSASTNSRRTASCSSTR